MQAYVDWNDKVYHLGAVLEVPYSCNVLVVWDAPVTETCVSGSCYGWEGGSNTFPQSPSCENLPHLGPYHDAICMHLGCR